MINFYKKKKYTETVQYSKPELQPLTLATYSVQRVKPVSRLWVEGQAAAGAQWEFLAPAGSSLDQAPRPGTGTWRGGSFWTGGTCSPW